jgi:uncharacterized protein (TIGR03663 family)
VVAVLNWYRRATSVSFVVAAAMAALLFATKETAVITVAALVLALIATDLFTSWGRMMAGTERPKSVFRQLLDRFGGPRHATWLLLGGIAIFLSLVVLFFSSFLGDYPKGLHDAIGALKFWVNVGAREHKHGLGTYISWLGQEELPLLVLGVAGTTVAAVLRQRFALFAGLWAFGLMAAYSLIPYKTPWLATNLIIPLVIVAGYAVDVIHRMLSARSTISGCIWLVLFGLAMTSSIYSTIQLNFYHYDDDRNPYVYAQTRREFLSLVKAVNTIARRSGSGVQTSIAVMSPIYWPLPWYLRDYKRAGYYGRISDARTDIVIGSEPEELRLALLLGKDYEWIGSYLLRPGVTLVLFARRQAPGSSVTSPGTNHANAQFLEMAVH